MGTAADIKMHTPREAIVIEPFASGYMKDSHWPQEGLMPYPCPACSKAAPNTNLRVANG